MNDRTRARLWRLLAACGFAIAVSSCTSRAVAPDAILAGVIDEVVTLRTADASQGSGFVVGRGLLITNAHMVVGKQVTIVRADGSRLPWEPLLVAKAHDVALGVLPEGLELSALDIRPAPARLGEPVYALGNPLGQGLTVTRGIVSAAPGAVGREDRLQTDAAINPGNSGGPLIDEQGRVVALVNARAAFGSGIGFAVPAPVLCQLLLAATADQPELVERLPAGCVLAF